MSNNDEWILRAFACAAFAAVCGFALYWIGGFLGSFEVHVLSPMFKFANFYFENYGRMTAVMILFITAFSGLLYVSFKEKEVIVKKFNEEVTERNCTISTLIQNEKVRSKTLDTKLAEICAKEKELTFKDCKIKSLELEIYNLEKEIERFKDPELATLKDEAAVKKSNDEKIKSIANSIHWGRS